MKKQREAGPGPAPGFQDQQTGFRPFQEAPPRRPVMQGTQGQDVIEEYEEEPHQHQHVHQHMQQQPQVPESTVQANLKMLPLKLYRMQNGKY